ncbi:transposase [Micromonospora sp. DT44]|uniref:transposase n=1 Tax=Micromonospora sp. DT44 TaxID=3393439 RepID=UPI003CE81CEE
MTGREPQPTAPVLDAQSIKSSEGGECRGFDMGKKTAGRERHLVVGTMGLVLVVIVTSASVKDRPGGRRILRRLAEAFTTIALVWGDGGYVNSIDSTLVSWAKTQLGILMEIVKRTDDVKGFTVLPRPWVV